MCVHIPYTKIEQLAEHVILWVEKNPTRNLLTDKTFIFLNALASCTCTYLSPRAAGGTPVDFLASYWLSASVVGL